MLRRSVVSLAQRWRRSLRHDGLGQARLAIVGHLLRAGPMSVTELAAREGVRLQSLTRPLAELIDDGWILREADAADGRRSVIALTAAGSKAVRSATRAADRSLARLLRRTLSDEERALLASACELLQRVDEALADEARAHDAADRSR
ncbi:MAG: MarR family transcriptional regulator [Burkholderiaceae bacterium]